MKFGVKTYFDPEFFKNFEEKSDFFEITSICGKNYDFLAEFNKPLVVHVMHEKFGVNMANSTLNQENRQAIQFGRAIADKNNAGKIIIHPGNLNSSKCSLQNCIKLLNNLKDSRILIENLPKYTNSNFIGTTPEEISEIMKKTGVGFCLDINHAVVTANFLGIDKKTFLKEFIKLCPRHYHLGGQKLPALVDSHISLKKSDLSIEEILRLIPENSEITLEVESLVSSVKEDLEWIKDKWSSINRI